MALAELASTWSPTRGGHRDPGYRAPQAPQFKPHPWMAPHERTSYFEDNPQQAFQAFSPVWGSGQKKQKISQSLQPILNQYFGQLGRQVMGGENPQGGFVDFLAGTQGYDQAFDFDSFYRNEFPGEETRRDAYLTPRINYF